MTDEIVINEPTLDPAGGDTVMIRVQYGAKNATIKLTPGIFLVAMTDDSWRDELKALALALQEAPITKA